MLQHSDMQKTNAGYHVKRGLPVALLCLAVLFLTGCAAETFALALRAQHYAQQSDYDAAIADLNVALARAPNSPDLLSLRGQMHLALYQWDRALADFNAALDLAPASAEVYYHRALLYYSVLQTGQELRAEALADFRRYLALAPDGPFAERAAEYARRIEAELAALDD